MSLPSANIIKSQITKSERWLKLYRTIHHLFLKDEFVHVTDYTKMVAEMNARITAVEAKATTEIAGLAAGLTTHFHMVPQAITGTLPSAPAAPVFTATPQPSKPVVIDKTAMGAYDAALMSTGPAQAPLADGIAPDQLLANTTVISDIGF
jgi:hypothetical protein